MSSTTSTSNIFEDGNYVVLVSRVDSTAKKSSCSSSSLSPEVNNPTLPTKPLLIAAPTEEGEYPVLLFLHGFLLYNSFYSQLIQHISSHGFIVIAPQLYSVAGPDTTGEIESAASIANWLSEGLHYVLPPLVRPNLNKVALTGHSRGGKVAFALALGLTESTTNSVRFSALIGIDPVDGTSEGSQTPPPVLKYIPKSFELDMAVMVIGSGFGEIKRNLLFPPCAPPGVNHKNFYEECRSPACYFVVRDYGHTDMLDDDTKGVRGKATYCTCKNGKARMPMRRFVGGIMVAFMKAYLENDPSDLNAIKNGHELLPVELQTVDFRM